MSTAATTGQVSGGLAGQGGRPESESLREALSRFRGQLSGGNIGPLSSILGLVSLFALFTALDENFASPGNIANLINQSAAVMFIAMGLVFVLLLGEIDLAAGFTAGVAAAVLVTVLTNGRPTIVAVLATLAAGAVIGLVIGILTAYLRIPSFVVTLAAFLALQGVLLAVIGEGGTIRQPDDTISDIMNGNLPVWLGWVLAVVGVLAFVVVGLLGRMSRARAGLPLRSRVIFWLTVAVLAVLVLGGTAILSVERSVNTELTSIRGLPNIVPIGAVVVIGLTFVLTRTRFGRHVFAVGGNAEAARRAGINVARVRVACFVIGSVLAAVAGILLASRGNSVSPATGGALTLLYAVAAAVIGGTSLFGGKGSIIAAVLGGLVIAVIRNGLPLVVKESYAQYIVTGLVLLLAATVDALSRRRQPSG